MEREKKYKKIIYLLLFLLFLLCISLVALSGTTIYKHVTDAISVSVPGNFIYPEEGGNTDDPTDNTENVTGTGNSNSLNGDNTITESNGSNNNSNGDSSNGTHGGLNGDSGNGTHDDPDGDFNNGSHESPNGDSNNGFHDGPDGGSNNGSPDGPNGSDNDNGSGGSKPASTVLSLHKGQFTDNEPFKVINMLPGDMEVKNYCLKVSYKNSGNIKFSVDTHNKPNKLLEVLKLKVVLLNNGEVLYNGLMKDMGELQTYTLKNSETAKTEELYYEVTSYLDTSVGNQYMASTELDADFKWWVDEKENLVRAPGKLDYSNVALTLGLLTGSLLILKLLRKKKIGGEPDAK